MSKNKKNPKALLYEPGMQLIWSMRQVAVLCNRSIRSMWRDVSAGLMPPTLKIGGRIYFRSEHIRQWLAWDCCDCKEFLRRLKNDRNNVRGGKNA